MNVDSESVGSGLGETDGKSSRIDRQSETAVLDRIESFRRRKPKFQAEIITLAHGAGGKASAALVESVFLEAFGAPQDSVLTDGAVIEVGEASRVVISTDSFVVKPRTFPGGSLGKLAVHGSINDVAMMGARPVALSVAFVLEEGFTVSELREVVADMAEAAKKAGVAIVTGDTKVVDRGAADGIYITSTCLGLLPDERSLSAKKVRDGDRIIVSGTIGDHGMAVMLARGNLALEAEISSDTAPLNELAEALLNVAPSTRWMRDPTRGGVGTILNELARDTDLAIVLDEESLPVSRNVAGACDLLGIDPLYVANEGKLVAIVAPNELEGALEVMRSHEFGQNACVIGEVMAEPKGIVVLRTLFGGTRIVDMLVGDPLPRIC